MTEDGRRLRIEYFLEIVLSDDERTHDTLETILLKFEGFLGREEERRLRA